MKRLGGQLSLVRFFCAQKRQEPFGRTLVRPQGEGHGWPESKEMNGIAYTTKSSD